MSSQNDLNGVKPETRAFSDRSRKKRNMTREQATELRRQLIEDGYCHLPEIAPDELINQIRETADGVAEGASEEHKRTHRFQGSIIDIWKHPEMAPIIALPSAREALGELGFLATFIMGAGIDGPIRSGKESKDEFDLLKLLSAVVSAIESDRLK